MLLYAFVILFNFSIYLSMYIYRVFTYSFTYFFLCVSCFE